MTAETENPTPTNVPDPPPGEATMPPAIGRVLSVVRKLIDYGKQLVATVKQGAATPGLAALARPFGSADIAVILARITNGLRRAAALEARLCQRAARGRDLTPSPFRGPACRTPGAARKTQPDAPPKPQPARSVEDPRLARLPTEEEIAAEVLRRPVGAVIVDICRDLGIRRGQLDRAFWDELCHAIISYGGSLASFFRDMSRRLLTYDTGDCADTEWSAPPPRLPSPATGPP